jgi:hypothetical protein
VRGASWGAVGSWRCWRRAPSGSPSACMGFSVFSHQAVVQASMGDVDRPSAVPAISGRQGRRPRGRARLSPVAGRTSPISATFLSATVVHRPRAPNSARIAFTTKASMATSACRALPLVAPAARPPRSGRGSVRQRAFKAREKVRHDQGLALRSESEIPWGCSSAGSAAQVPEFDRQKVP